MKKLYLFVACCMLPFLTMAQGVSYNIGAGVGVGYGGVGVKATTASETSWFGVTGGIGYSNGVPLSFGVIGEGTNNESLNSSTVKGLGFSLGFVGYLDHNNHRYLGLQLVGLGNYQREERDMFGNPKYENAGYIYCVNVTLLGWRVPIGGIINLDFVLNAGIGGGAGKTAAYCGLDVGLGVKL